MSQSRFVTKQFAGIDLESAINKITFNQTPSDICIGPGDGNTLSTNVPIFDGTDGVTLDNSNLQIYDSSNNFVVIGPGNNDPESNSSGIVMATQHNTFIEMNDNNNNYNQSTMYTRTYLHMLDSNVIAPIIQTYNQTPAVTSSVTITNAPIIRINTVSATTAAGSSFTFTVICQDNNFVSNASVKPSVLGYSGTGIPYVIVSSVSSSQFTLKVFNIHPSAAFNASICIDILVHSDINNYN